MAEDAASGLYDRMRSLPIADSAVLAGRGIADAALMVVVAIGHRCSSASSSGFRMSTTVAEVVLALGLLVVYALCFAIVFVWLGLVSGNAQAAQGLSILAVPFSFISSAFVPIATMPGPVQAFAKAQPLTFMVNAWRGLLLGDAVTRTFDHGVSYYVIGSFIWAGRHRPRRHAAGDARVPEALAPATDGIHATGSSGVRFAGRRSSTPTTTIGAPMNDHSALSVMKEPRITPRPWKNHTPPTRTRIIPTITLIAEPRTRQVRSASTTRPGRPCGIRRSAANSWCSIWIATEPSPTADATRFTEPFRTSPAASTPGMLVSNGKRGRSVGPTAPRSRPVTMKPCSSRVMSGGSHSVLRLGPDHQEQPVGRHRLLAGKDMREG